MLPALLVFYRPCLSSQLFITDTLSIWLKFWSVFFASSMNILVFGAPTECWLLHNRPLILGPASNGHGLYCHSSCFGYCLCYIIIGISVHLLSLFLYLTATVFCFTSALFYHLDLLRLLFWVCLIFLCLSLPMWDSWHHVPHRDLLKITLMYACMCIYIAMCK